MSRWWVVFLLLATALLSIGAAGRALEQGDANSLWVAEREGVLQLASSDGSLRAEISGFARVRAVALDVRRETVWLLGDRELAAFDLSGERRVFLDVEVPRSVHADVAVVPSTGAVWMGAGGDLLNIGPEGQQLGSFELTANTVALAVDETEDRLWVGTERSVEVRDLVTGALVGEIDLPPRERLNDLRAQLGTGRLWIAAGDRARLYEGSGELVLDARFDGLQRVAPAPGHAAWIANRKEIARLTTDGRLEAAFEPLGGKGAIEHLVVSGEGTIWVASQTSIARVARDGTLVDRISFEPPIRIWDLATNSDGIPPSLSLLSPGENACLADAQPSLELAFSDLGWGVDPETARVSVDALPVPARCAAAAEGATCRVQQPITDGERTLAATVSDFAGNESAPVARRVVVDTVPPEISVTEPAEGAVVEEAEITVTGALGETAELTIDGAPVAVPDVLSFSHGPLALEEGSNEIELVAVDCAGNTSRLLLTIEHRPGSAGDLPPDPATVAPPLDSTVSTELYDASRFLYEGPTPIQLEVEPGAVDPARVAVVRGRVTTRAGEPLPGVRIQVHGHPEFGHTLSRRDGAYDLAVNGGAVSILEYSKTGYLPAHRPVETPLRDFVVADEVVLLPYDDRATAVELGAAEAQVVRGNPSTDQDGTRQATVIVPAGTRAELVLPDGSTRSVASLTVRATEYTVGPRGPRSMPAPLPATSGYTYALELSADEAVAAGASRVTFSEPVVHYVENFLGFPVGGIVPAGFYDREQALWVPADNGRIVEVLDVVDERAVLDVTGDGQAASGEELVALGITGGELRRLGELYAPGQSLWRTPIPHFTPWDCNWPYGPPEDAEEPPEPDAEKPDPDDEEAGEEQDDDEPAGDEDDPACESGSVIECENQVLGEEIPLVGTSQSLHYRSSRVPGRRLAYAMKVRLSGRSVPVSLRRIELRIDVAGRRIRRTFAPVPNRTYTFTWDGRGAYGRLLHGRQKATAHVGYVYGAVYYEPAELPSSFAAVSPRTRIVGDRSALEITLWRSAETMLGISDARMIGLGGWTLSDHHLYHASSASRELHSGDGRTQVEDDLGAVGSVWEAREHPILDRPVLGPFGLTPASDGGFYYIDLLPQGIAAPYVRVWKVGPDGERERAVFVTRRNDLPQVAVGPTGDVYVATCDGFVQGRIRNLRTGEVWSSFATGCFDGLVVAPDGSFYYGRDEIVHRRRDGTTSTVFTPPTRARIGSRTIDPEGRLYVGIWATNRVWRIDPDGSARVVAGTGVPGFGGDGGPATEARLDFPEGLAIARDGSLLIADLDNHRVRRVSPSGIITTVMGSGESEGTPGLTSPLAAGLRRPIYLATTADGRVIVGDSPGQNGEILQLEPRFPRFTPQAETLILSDSGTEVFAFDSRGRHLRTHDALTGTVERTFDYDAAGRLRSITDAFGNVTRVERAGDGAPTAIVAPFGERTELEIDDRGFLASVTNPAGGTHRFDSSNGGLLRSITDPRGFESTYEYSALGRLVRAGDPAGGAKRLRRWVRGGGRYRVALRTAEGRETSYARRQTLDGTVIRSTSTAAGGTVQTTERRDGSRVVDLPSGTSVRTVEGADPRFGLQSPLVTGRTVTTPGGRSMQASSREEAILSSPADLFGLSSFSRTWTVNGRQSSEVFDATTREVTTTSPMGRTTVTMLDEHSRARTARTPGLEELRYQYDARGRLSRVAQGQGDTERVLSLAYGDRGRLVGLTDPLGREVRFHYDAAGRLIRQTRTDGREIRFAYDANGNLVSIVPPDQPPHLFRYTPVDSVEEYEPPELDFGDAATTYSYDRDRRLVQVRRPDGRSLELTYDAAGRTDALSYPSGRTDFTFLAENGQLLSVTAGETEVSYSYDGFLRTATTWSGPVQGTVERSYDDNFWLRSRSVGGSSVTFDYDRDGLLTRAGEMTVSRDAASGRIAGTAVGSVETGVGYNPFGEIETLRATVAGAPLYAVAFERDRLGRITGKIEEIEGVSRRSEVDYDPAGRLQRVTRDGQVVEEYRYDGNGNRLAATYPWGQVTGTYDEQDRLLAYGDATYTYTAAGELASRTEAGATTRFDYDVFGNLRRVELPSGDVVEYAIDGRNRRVGRTINGILVQGFLYKDALNPVAELDGAGSVVARFVYGTRANVPDTMIRGGTTYRLISDHLGSVRLVVDAETGAIAQRLDYDAFGRVVLDTNPGFQPFGFAGGLHDPLTGLVRFGARDYDPRVGRWTSKDPILFGGGDANLFSYLLSDPVNAFDASGLAQICRRPLADLPWMGPLSDNGGNRQVAHEQIFYEDPRGGDEGFFDDGNGGIVRPDDPKNRKRYEACDPIRYRDDLLRKAAKAVNPGTYDLMGNNCQHWVERVRKEYERLLREEVLGKLGRKP